jgi:hypothetical protein
LIHPLCVICFFLIILKSIEDKKYKKDHLIELNVSKSETL